MTTWAYHSGGTRSITKWRGRRGKAKGKCQGKWWENGRKRPIIAAFFSQPIEEDSAELSKGVLMLRMLPGGPGGSRGTATDRRKRRCWQMKRSKERPETHQSHKPDHKAAEKPLCTSKLQRLAPPKYQPYPYLGDALKKYLIAAYKMANRCFLYKQAAVEGAFATRWDVDCGSPTLIWFPLSSDITALIKSESNEK